MRRRTKKNPGGERRRKKRSIPHHVKGFAGGWHVSLSMLDVQGP
jgi:hypothetical protein